MAQVKERPTDTAVQGAMAAGVLEGLGDLEAVMEAVWLGLREPVGVREGVLLPVRDAVPVLVPLAAAEGVPEGEEPAEAVPELLGLQLGVPERELLLLRV